MKHLVRLILIPLAMWAASAAQAGDTWNDIVDKARGQTVYFHAWGGEPRINSYIAWAGEQVKMRYGVEVVHVKVSETANVVGQVLAEKAAGKTVGGSVDLVWINGENFGAMKVNGLLADKGWAEALPNWAHVDVDGKPTVRSDFTVPTEGQESPWGMAKLVFMHDSSRLAEPPRTLQAIADYARTHPGRVAYPQPPNFYGTTFLKQILVTLVPSPGLLQEPVDPASFDAAAAPLFEYLDRLHPDLWRKARAFPKDAAHMRQLLADGELDIAFSFNPGDASSAIANGEVPPTVRSFVLDGGTLGNTHFVAIPFNSSAREGAMVLADFLLSPEAQARKQDPKTWGDPTVLNVAGLSISDQALFRSLDLGPATLTPEDLGPTLPEPHPSWVAALETAWQQRYGVAE